MKFSTPLLAAIAGLVSVNAEQVFVCDSNVPGSRALGNTFVHVPAEGEVLPSGCVDISAPEGDFDSFIVEPQNADAFKALESLGGEFVTSRLSDDFHLVHSPAASTEGMQDVLHQSDMELVRPAPFYTDHSKLHSREAATLSAAQQIEKDAVVASVQQSGSLYMRELNKLTGEDGTLGISGRCSFSPDHVVAATYIRDFFAAQGLESSFQNFTFSGTRTQNVIGVKTGTRFPDEIVVVGGHYDSTSQSCASSAPGAVDNGSGTVNAMVLAQLFKDVEFERTIHFIGFGGEEQGIHGSQYYVDNRGNVVGALLSDMTAYSSRFFGVTIEGTTNSNIRRLTDLAEVNTKQYAPALSINRASFSFGSDHVPFQRAGVPAFLWIEQDDTNYVCYHRTCDEMQYVSEAQAVAINAANAATLYDVANGVF